MRLCIVGASGFIGSSLKNNFTCLGEEIVSVSSKNLPDCYTYDHLKDLDSCIEILSKIDTLIYLCSPDQYQSEINPGIGVTAVLGPLGNILSAKEKLPNLKIIYLSTAQIFNAVPPSENVTTLTEVRPNNYYGLFHVFGENMINYFRSKHKQLNLISLRLTNSFGFSCSTDCKWSNPVVNQFISNSHDMGVINIHSDGSPMRDFMEISRLTEVVIKLSKSTELPESIILGSGVNVNLSYVIDKIQSAFSYYYGKKVYVDSSVPLCDAEVRDKPRFSVDERYANMQSKSELDSSLIKAILDYERFKS